MTALKPSSTSPYFTVSLKPAPKSAGTKPGSARPADQVPPADGVEMDVRLDPHAPVGPLDARLMITMPSGEQLVLPTFAVVRPGAAATTPSAATRP